MESYIEDTGRPIRDRNFTERGLEYQKELRAEALRSGISRWRKQADDATIVLLHQDTSAAAETISRLDTEFERVRAAYHSLISLLQPEEMRPVDQQFDPVQKKNHELYLDLTHLSRTGRLSSPDAGMDTRSIAGSNRTSVSGHSHQSTSSRRAAAAEAAAAETRLKYMEAESKYKVELELLQAKKELEVANAKLQAIQRIDMEDQGISDQKPFLPDRKEDQVSRWIQALNPGGLDGTPAGDSWRPRYETEHSVPYSHVQQQAQQQAQSQGHPSSAYHHSSPIGASADPTVNLARLLTQQLEMSRLPPPEPTVFHGDPLKYPGWKASFEMLIESKDIPATERLHYLSRYTGGPAKEAVEGLFLLDSVTAYQEARIILEERFGHPFLITESFRDKLEAWPKVKLPSELRRFSDFLGQCQVAMTCVPGLEILNDCRENRKLLRKLPDWVVRKWSKVVVQTVGRYPSFAEFSNFIRSESDMANHPITTMCEEKKPFKSQREKARCLSTDTKEKPKQQDRTNVRSFKEHTSPVKENTPSVKDYSPKPCFLCSKTDHQLVSCPEFLAKSLEERKKYVQDNRLCFGCLRKGHRLKDCQRRIRCTTCNRRHPTSLHEDWSPTDRESNKQSTKDEESEKVTVTKAFSSSINNEDQPGTSMIVPVWLSKEDQPTKEILTYAILDHQSDATFVSESLASRLKSDMMPIRLSIRTLTTPNSTPEQSSLVKGLIVRGVNVTKRIAIPKAYTTVNIPIERSQIPTPQLARNWPHLKHLETEIPEVQDCDVGLLIGTNCPAAGLPREILSRDDDEPYGIRTDLGWSIIQGSGVGMLHPLICHRTRTTELPEISPTEVLSVLHSDFAEDQSSTSKVSLEDLYFLEIVEAGVTTTDDGHIMMPLPFRSRPKLPNNRKLAVTRLRHLSRKMDNNDAYREQYTGTMKDIIEAGFAERATEPGTDGHVNYIPHHGVTHKKKGKLRVVFDCSARFGGTSLNDHLLKGPDLTNGLFGVLCRFRLHKVALLCDVEKMFFQFQVPESDRDFLRFVWWENDDTSQEPVDYRMTVHLFGAVSSPGCANFGIKYLAKRYQDKFPAASLFITRDFYVDDGVTSVPETEEAIDLAKDARELCSKGGLRLHKFVSNDKAVVDSIPESERSKDSTNLNLDFDSLPLEPALGISWSPGTDMIKFEGSFEDKPMTRRGVLSIVASLFDPLGLVAPVVLVGKSILQEMCHLKIGWDDVMPEELQVRWEEWLSDLRHLRELEIPRCLQVDNLGQVLRTELHHFSDASSSGYGQCSYLRLIGKDKVHCSLICGKARVAPLKMVTIPRLELTAALVSALVARTLKDELPISVDAEYFWTDSKAVLGYIGNETKRFHVFVANRVTRIHQVTKADQWFYVPTEQNPADVASRGADVKTLVSSRWLQGPSFLWDAELPSCSVKPEIAPDDPEVKTRSFATHAVKDKMREDVLLTRMKKFSSWTTAVRALTRLRRYVRYRTGKATDLQSPLSEDEKQDMQEEIFRRLQQEAFSEDMMTLRKSDAAHKVGSRGQLRKLDPFLDSKGLLRVGGRLHRSSLQFEVKHPVILPKGYIVDLLVRHHHEKVAHQGRGITIAEIRASGFWIVGLGKVVASCIHRCVTCRKLRRRILDQKMADLPVQRIEPSPPFTYVGIDCFGPFIVKDRRSELKRYGLIFTCMASRAVHLECLDDMSTDSFINGLRCFIALRGPVRTIFCDRGSNFVGAATELKLALQEVKEERVRSFLADHQCDFVFNAPSASHMGGVWERQIRSIRNPLEGLQLHTCRLDTASLRTLLYEAMAIVNSRPLSRSYSDSDDAEILTPNHILHMKNGIVPPPPGTFCKEDLYTRKRWRRIQHLANQFWHKWRREYLHHLQVRQKWTEERRNVQEGDIVFLKEEDLVRSYWKLARVIEAVPDSDGHVRKVKLLMGDSTLSCIGKRTKEASVLERPIHKLILLIENEEHL